jgi:hypothetical protein
MKMLAFLTSELSNSATYFPSFADVDKKSVGELNGTFGREPTDTWKPWKYEDRIRVVKAVENFKEKQDKKNIKKAQKDLKSHLLMLCQRADRNSYHWSLS